MINHRKVPYEISIGQRIAQIIFHKVERLVLWKPTHCQNQKDNVVVLVQLTTKLYKIFSFNKKKHVFYRSWSIKQTFYDCYKIIDNIQSNGFWYCRCCNFSGCQTVLSFLKNDKRYCFVCQFQDGFSYLNCIRSKGKILDRIEEMIPFYTKDQYFWNKEIHHIVKNDHYNETVNFLFNLDV